MKKEKTVFVVDGDESYANWLLPIGYKLVGSPELATLLFFTGGPDVSPFLYGENVGSRTWSDKNRDLYELDIFNKFPKTNKIGVCLGGQHLTVFNGYKLVQHMNHPGRHPTITLDGQVLESTSTHHQQFLLQENGLVKSSKYTLLGWAEKLSPIHLNGDDEDYRFPQDYKEPEIVLYENDNCKSLAVQMHPEFFPNNHPTVTYLQNLVTNVF